jgi:urease accessory protein UreF
MSTLLESLPGIANVLRSPVADALVNVMRAAARLTEFDVADAEELVRYATRRGLLGQEEGDRLLAEILAARQKKLDRAAERPKAAAAKAKAKAKGKAKPKPKARHKPAPKKAAKKKKH